jgi:thioredoxin
LYKIKFTTMNKSLLLTILLTAIIAISCGNAASKPEANTNNEPVLANKVELEHLTFETFKEKVWDFEANPKEWVYKGSEPCIIDFYADWCGPCKIIAPIMEELADEYDGKIIIYKIDTETERELAAAFGIRSIPSVLFSPLEGKPMMQSGAMTKNAYVKVIEEQLLLNTQE